MTSSTHLIQQCLACMYVCTKHTSSTSYVALLNVFSSLQQRNRTRLIALYFGRFLNSQSISRIKGPPYFGDLKRLFTVPNSSSCCHSLLAASSLKTVQSALLRVPYSKKEHFKKDSTLAVVFEAVACLF